MTMRPAIDPGDRFQLLSGGAEAYPRMIAAIEGASRSIHLEVYAFGLDGAGTTFVKALSEAAARGVEVFVIVDGWGSAAEGRTLVAMLGAAGCRASIFNPLSWLFLGKYRRNHRKVLVVDEQVDFVGGLNIGDEFIGPKGWVDLALEIRGPSAAWLGQKLRGRRPGATAGSTRILLSGLGGGARLRRRFLKAFGRAEHEIWIAHSYFLPDRRLLRALLAAARRGVRVRLLVPGQSDVGLAKAGTESLYTRLADAGVRIYELADRILHAKAVAVDGEITLLGSFNLDSLSLANMEVLAEVVDPALSAKVQTWIAARLAEARPIILSDSGSQQPGWWGTLAGRASQWLGRVLARG
jgi:cardiolipin synthase